MKTEGRITLCVNQEPDVACVSRRGSSRESLSARFHRGRLGQARRLLTGAEVFSLSLLFTDGEMRYELPLENDGRDLIEDLGEAREWLLKRRRGHG